MSEMVKTIKSKRRSISLVVFGILLVMHYLMTDPQIGLVKDLSFGVQLVYVTQILFWSAFGVVLTMFMPSLVIDSPVVDDGERDLLLKAKTDPVAAALLYVGNSIRLFAWAMIFIACLLMFGAPIG